MQLLSRHVAFDRIMDLVEGRLSPEATADDWAHLASCTRCGSDRAFVEQTIGEMRTTQLEDARPQAIARAVALFRPAEPAPSPLRRLIAALTFDSGMAQPALAMRSSAPAARQVLLEAGPYDLDLRIVPSGALWTVSGQVLSPGTSGRVELRGSETASAALNALGEFNLGPLPAGSYTLDVELADVAIEFSALELGS